MRSIMIEFSPAGLDTALLGGPAGGRGAGGVGVQGGVQACLTPGRLRTARVPRRWHEAEAPPPGRSS